MGRILLVLIMILDVVVPAVILLYLLLHHANSIIEWALKALLALSYASCFSMVWPAFFLGFYWRLAVWLAFVTGIIISYRAIKPETRKACGYILLGVSVLFTLLFSTCTVWTAAAGYRCPQQYISLDFPFRDGVFCVYAGGGTLSINHHMTTPNQIYGVDIVKLNRMAMFATGILPGELRDYTTFGSKLYSPCDAVILRVEDGNEDMPVLQFPEENTAGNLILLKHHDYKILLGHLRNGSISVSEGDQVARGQFMAEIRNSGQSGLPHLHMSVATGGSANGVYDGTGVAVKYDGRFLVRNSLVFAGE